MKNRKTSLVRVAGFSALMLSSTYALSFPPNEYACQMETIGAGHGLVMVQTTTREKAAEIALEQRARTATGQYFKSAAVVECIVFREERFKDDAFHAYFRSVDL